MAPKSNKPTAATGGNKADQDSDECFSRQACKHAG